MVELYKDKLLNDQEVIEQLGVIKQQQFECLCKAAESEKMKLYIKALMSLIDDIVRVFKSP